jgi:plasmid stability protein
VADDPQDMCVLSLQKFPKELKKRLKVRAVEREIELQELCAEYLRAGIEREELQKSNRLKQR